MFGGVEDEMCGMYERWGEGRQRSGMWAVSARKHARTLATLAAMHLRVGHLPH